MACRGVCTARRPATSGLLDGWLGRLGRMEAMAALTASLRRVAPIAPPADDRYVPLVHGIPIGIVQSLATNGSRGCL